MKRRGILHAELAGRLAGLGHTDLVCVADCGLPIPRETPVVDLALVQGLPAFADVLDALLDEIVVEGYVVAREATGGAADRTLEQCAGLLGPREEVPHEELKELVGRCALVVRTGEATPYANVVLRCGVAF